MVKVLHIDVEEGKLGDTVVDIQTQLERDRQPYEDLKQSCVDLSLPIRGDVSDHKTGSGDEHRGEKRGLEIFDDETVVALQDSVNGLCGNHVSATIDWFLSKFYHRELNENDEVKQWFEDTDHINYDILRRSETFYDRIIDVFLDGMGTGEGTMFIEPNRRNMTVDAIVPNIWEMYFKRDQYGSLVAKHRLFKMAAVEIKNEFGEKDKVDSGLGMTEGLPYEVAKALQDKKPFQEFEFINAIYKNPEYDPAMIGPKYMPWSSYTVFRKRKVLMREKGYSTENPLVFSVFRPSDEDYGRGITGNAIVSVARSNQMSKTLLNAANWASDPAWKLNKGLNATAELWPGGRTLIDDVGNESVEAIKTFINWPVSNEERQRITDAVKSHYMLKFFEMFTNLDKDARVLELMEMRAEKAVQMGRFLGLINVFLDKILDRVRTIGFENGWYPDPPQILLDFLMMEIGPQPDRLIEVDHIGPISQLQKQLFQTRPIQHGLASSMPIFEQYPSTKDLINGDRLLKKNLTAFHFPTDVMNDEDEVEQIRRVRAEREQMMLAAELAGGMADAVPKLQGETKKGSPLAKMEKA